MKLIVHLLVYALGIFVAANILPGIHVDGWQSLLILTIVLLLLKALVKPILVILTLPISVLTLGLFMFVINGVIILLADALVSGFNVDGFGWAIVFSLVLSVIVWVLEKVSGTNRK